MSIHNQEARAEAWKRYAMRQVSHAADMEQLAAHLEGKAAYVASGPCPNCEDLRHEIRWMERDAREDSRGAYGEGYPY